MSVPKHRKSKSAVRTKRAHLALKTLKTVKCPECGAASLPHRACPSCGMYKGRKIMATKTEQIEKREVKRKKKEEKDKLKQRANK